MLKHGIRIAGKSHQVEICVREGLDSPCHLCNEWGHTQNKCTKTDPTCGICAEKHAYLFIYFISFNVIQPMWLCRQILTHKIADMSERRKQANKQNKTKQHT
jgi:hypothetical protein